MWWDDQGYTQVQRVADKVLQRHGYFKGGLPKIEVARMLGQKLDPKRCKSPSFTCFRNAVLEAVQATLDGA